MNLSKVLILLFFSVFLSSCIPAVITTSFIVGNVSTREKSFNDAKKDIAIEYVLKNKFISEGVFAISPFVEEGRVFLMGRVPKNNSSQITEAIRLSWKENDVMEVINEVQIIKDYGMIFPFFYAKDSLITIIVNSKIAFLDNVKYANYKFKTINSVVYVMGIAQNESELQKVSETIASTRIVKKVISHAVYIDDERRG
jgi:osmotically-inducible protein OsmY